MGNGVEETGGLILRWEEVCLKSGAKGGNGRFRAEREREGVPNGRSRKGKGPACCERPSKRNIQEKFVRGTKAASGNVRCK